MGYTQVRAAQDYLKKAGRGGLSFVEFPVTLSMKTAAYKVDITDSAAAGTAIACGNKTRKGYLGIDHRKRKLNNITGIAKRRGYKTILISSVSLDHATPAAFYARCKDRNNFRKITGQAVKSAIDLFAGGGFLGCQKECRKLFEKEGWTFIDDQQSFEQLISVEQKTVLVNPVLDQKQALLYAAKNVSGSISLAQFTAKAIELFKDEDYFMMVEGGKIDWACHDNDLKNTIADIIAFDQAVQAAIASYQKDPGNTTIIVTADHECGGLQRDENGNFIWTSDYHTAVNVPVYVLGDNDGVFKEKEIDNTDLFQKLKLLIQE